MVDIAALLLAAVIAQLDLGLGLTFMVFNAIAMWSTGLQAGRLAPRVSDEIPYLIRNVAVAMLAVGLVAQPNMQLGETVRLGILVIVLVLLLRAVFYDLLRRLRRRGIALERVVIVGAGPTAIGLATALDEHPECGLTPQGFVDDNEPPLLSLPYLGTVTDLSHIMAAVDTRYAIFAFGAAREFEMISTIRRCDPRSYFYVLYRFFELGTSSGPPAQSADIAGFPVRRIHPPAAGNPRLWIKRVIDLILSAVALIIFTPLMIVCAGLVAATSPGPVLFRQERVGRDGAHFDILKFRTMTVNSDSDITWSVEHDNRVTTVGRLLRASHLDELPQLANVLRGDMSLVGPRPERPFFVDQFSEQVSGYQDRHRVKSGITGWSQVNGLVGDSSIEERARNDNWYIERWSVWADMLIVLRTLPTMLRRSGSHDQSS
jgi:exopolysaccharide biosynthesis polyprenyl glycosylphosphotransferase